MQPLRLLVVIGLVAVGAVNCGGSPEVSGKHDNFDGGTVEPGTDAGPGDDGSSDGRPA